MAIAVQASPSDCGSDGQQLNPLAVHFGKNLLRCRKQAGLSQERLAVCSSLHRTEVGLLERGERLPRIDTAIKVATALSVPLDELISGMEWTAGTVQEGSFVRPERSP